MTHMTHIPSFMKSYAFEWETDWKFIIHWQSSPSHLLKNVCTRFYIDAKHHCFSHSRDQLWMNLHNWEFNIYTRGDIISKQRYIFQTVPHRNLSNDFRRLQHSHTSSKRCFYEILMLLFVIFGAWKYKITIHFPWLRETFCLRCLFVFHDKKIICG